MVETESSSPAAMAETESSSPASMSIPASGESIVDDQPKSGLQQPGTSPPTKRKRNLAGMPNPGAEVIALSPTTLLATNRFVCEICNKGFQRDQNLQLHRRGHNLPWKLRQRSSGEVARKRVYVCPEPTCAHHDPSRALGDLTGIKKHFSRKHGEKKFKCDRCSKNYAVRSDWKAHMKTCGTREYPCDCGTVFSRRDSFITHRAFCDALARETSRSQPPPTIGEDSTTQNEATPAAASPPPPPLTPITGVLSSVLSVQSSAAEFPDNQKTDLHPPPPPPPPPPPGPAALTTSIAQAITTTAGGNSSSTATGNVSSTASTLFPTTFSPSTSEALQFLQGPVSHPSLICPISGPARPAIDPMSLSLSPSLYGPPSFFPSTSQNYLPGPQPALSATALLQKAAQMNSISSGNSFLCGLGLGPPSPSGPKQDPSAMASGLGLGSSVLNDLMMGPSIFGEKPATLDFLGLGMEGEDRAGAVGFSAFLSSMDGLSEMRNDPSWGDESSDRISSL